MIVRSFLLVASMSMLAVVSQAAPVYIVNDAGFIRLFSGIDDGATPLTAGSFATSGTIINQVPGYGTYQGFTQIPDGSIIGVNQGGGVDGWSDLSAWTSNAAPLSLGAAGTFGAENSNNNGDGSLHGFSYDGNTGGIYAVLEGGGEDGDVAQFATVADFLTNTRISTSAAAYGGNLLNFYYPDEDAPGTTTDNIAGSNYFQVTGGGVVEGFVTLDEYIEAPSNARFAQGGFGGGVRSGFAVVAVPEPSSVLFGLCVVAGCCTRRSRKS